MNHYMRSLSLALALIGTFQGYAQQLTIDASRKGAEVSPSLFGVFFEEISHAGEGGLYAEMIRNRSFEDQTIPTGTTYRNGRVFAPARPNYRNGSVRPWSQFWNPEDTLQSWDVKWGFSSQGECEVTDARPLFPKNRNSLHLDIERAAPQVAVINSGFWGISVVKGTRYNLRFFMLHEGYRGTVLARVVDDQGKVVAESRVKPKASGQWMEYNAVLQATDTQNNGEFQLIFDAPGSIYLDFVSLFPAQTFRNRPNGLRADVAQLIQDIKPAFVRWPGGCIVEGATLGNRVEWKETLGDPAARKGEYSLWGYRNTYGWGFHEWLQYCEDIGAKGMYVCNVGLSCEFRNGDYSADDSIPYFVTDVLDAIEYAIGDVKTEWGRKRAQGGHPKPFPLQYVEIGNENYGPIYYKRYNIFYKAIKEKYPQLTLISNVSFADLEVSLKDEIAALEQKTDMVDAHWYQNPQWFFTHAHMFDKFQPRPPHKMYVGEYACNKEVGAGSMYGALSEAAFLTGIERNSDWVVMASYAPLLENSNKRDWPVNLIWLNNHQTFGRSSYWVQLLFNRHLPTVNLATELSGLEKPLEKGFPGLVGLGTLRAAGAFKDFKMQAGYGNVYKPIFVWDLSEWKWTPDFTLENGEMIQADTRLEHIARLVTPYEGDFTMEVKVKKTSGRDAFQILLGGKDDKNYYRLVLGGFNSAGCGLEKVEDGKATTLTEVYPVSLEVNRWYDVRVEAKGNELRVFVDGKLQFTYLKKETYRQYANAGYDARKGELVVKVVNAEATPMNCSLSLKNFTNIAPSGTLIVLASQKPEDENSFEDPLKISPKEQQVSVKGAVFTQEFKPYSLSILRIKCTVPVK